jgi:DNA-binding beta-propeller fold protein YncE
LVSEDFPSAPGGFAAGSRIAGYLLEEQIGQGGMAVVFRAHDDRLDRRVALKILAPALAADEAFRQRFIRESRAAAAVDDPHIIPVFEAGEASGVLFIAMRYVRGGDVRSLITQSGPLPPGRVAEIISQVASALDAAHGRGLVHRDVKPANMLLDSSGGAGRPDHVYLSDFGLSKASLQASGLTGTGTFLGTLDYISPEQIEGKPVDGRADQYALACAAYELLCGSPPFQREEAMAVMYAQLSEPPPALTSRRPDLPPAVDDVFARALAKAPASRYASCRDFCDDLREAFGIRPYDSGPGTSPGPVRPATELASWASGAGAPPSGTVAAGVAGGTGPIGAAANVPSAAGAAVPGMGQATQLAPQRHTTPGLTEAHWSDDGTGQRDTGRAGGRPAWRSPIALVAAIIVVVVLGGGGAYLALHGSTKKPSHTAASVTLPGASTVAAAGKTLTVPSTLTTVTTGNPFAVLPSQDGKVIFATDDTNLNVLVRGPGTTITRQYGYAIFNTSSPGKGMALTSDGKDLLIAAGNGINVQSEVEAEAGDGAANVGVLTVPNSTGNDGAVEVELSPDGKYAFVTLQYANKLAVFDVQQALSSGNFSSSSYVGSVSLPDQPVGMSLSPDGDTLYVASFGSQPGQPAAEGTLSVLNIAKLETAPASAISAQVPAGFSSARVLASPDGKTVWVTARASNYVLAYSAAKLISSPKHALIAKVQVGQTPIGMIMIDNGAKLLVADTDINNTSPTAHNLAVIDVAKALAGKPSLLGYIPVGGTMPREFGLISGGRYLIVSDNGSAQVQIFDLSKLP